MYTLTINDLPRYPARFFHLANALTSMFQSMKVMLESLRMALQMSSIRWSAHEQELLRYLAASVDYTDFEYRMKNLKYMGKL